MPNRGMACQTPKNRTSKNLFKIIDFAVRALCQKSTLSITKACPDLS